MKKIELSNLDMNIYQEKLDNGLEIYLIPYENKKNYYISYATKYGSDITEFDYDNKKYTPPLGIAHYLEHKMFEMESGEDPFTFFSQSGTDSNAMTSFESTKYICHGTKNFGNNLRYLLKFVNQPYFTDENVEKEKGIISEEIKMYDDLPDFKIEMNLRRNIYKSHPRRNDIAGSIEEIKKITKEDLYKCYNSFYIPNNMFVIVAGNFDIKEAEKIIKEEINSKESKSLPKIYDSKEPKPVLKKEETIHVPIEIPKVAIGIKIPKTNMDLFEQDLYLTMLSTLLFGASSEFRERVRKKELLNEIYLEWESIKDFNTFYLFATTTKPNSLMEAIEEELDNINVSEKDFERIKKVWIANEVKTTDNITSMQRSIFFDLISYNRVIDNKIDLIRKMSFKKLTKIIKETDFKNRSKLIALSNNKE